MVFQLVQSRVKHLHLSIERVKLLLIPVDLACILVIENTNLLTEHSDSLLDFSEISIAMHCPTFTGDTSGRARTLGVIAVGVPLDPIDQACFLNSSTRTRVFSL